MKHGLLDVLLVAACLALATSCSGRKLEPLPAPVAGADYFPLVDGDAFEFSGGTAIGSGPIEADGQQWDVTAATAPDGEEGFIISRRGRGILNAMEMIYGLRDGDIVTWSGMFGVAKTEFLPPLVELPETIAPGARWTWAGESKGVALRVRSELEGVEELVTGKGLFKCLRIRREFNDGAVRMTQWYAAGVGLVKVMMKNAGGRVELQR